VIRNRNLEAKFYLHRAICCSKPRALGFEDDLRLSDDTTDSTQPETKSRESSRIRTSERNEGGKDIGRNFVAQDKLFEFIHIV